MILSAGGIFTVDSKRQSLTIQTDGALLVYPLTYILKSPVNIIWFLEQEEHIYWVPNQPISSNAEKDDAFITNLDNLICDKINVSFTKCIPGTSSTNKHNTAVRGAV